MPPEAPKAGKDRRHPPSSLHEREPSWAGGTHAWMPDARNQRPGPQPLVDARLVTNDLVSGTCGVDKLLLGRDTVEHIPAWRAVDIRQTRCGRLDGTRSRRISRIAHHRRASHWRLPRGTLEARPRRAGDSAPRACLRHGRSLAQERPLLAIDGGAPSAHPTGVRWVGVYDPIRPKAPEALALVRRR